MSMAAASFADADLEAAVLAALGRDEEAYWRYAEDYLVPDAFAMQENRRAFLALGDSFLGRAGPPELPPAEPPADLDAAVRRLVDLAQRRMAAEVVAGLWSDLRAGKAVQDALAAAAERLAQAQQAVRILAPGEGRPLADLLREAEREYEEARVCMAATGRPTPHPTWGGELKSLTYMTGGLAPGVWVLGGEPGAGKTSFATYMLFRYLEAERDACGLWVDAGETRPPTRWAVWFACVAAQACFQKIERYAAPLPELRRVLEAAQPYAQRVAFLEANSNTLAAHVRGAARRLMARSSSKRCALVLDYLQKFAAAATRPGEDYRTKVNSVLTAFSEMRDVVQGPVIIISSLTKDAWRDAEAGLAGFKESGEIAHAADVAMILRLTGDPRNTDAESAVREIEVSVLKNRLGPTGSVTVYADRTRSRFGETDPGRVLMPPEARGEAPGVGGSGGADGELPF